MNFGNKDNPDSITAITDNKTLVKAESGKETADTLIYKVLPDGTAVIAAYLGKFQDLAPTVELNIPEQIEGHTVVAIGDNALRDGHAKIVGITLPSTIKEIGVDAIYAEELRYLRLNDGLETLKDGAIYCGTTLDTLVIPQSVRYIGYEAICAAEDKINAGILCEEGENCASNRFSDLPPANKDVSHKGIEFCLKRGIINGKGNGIFDPSGVLTHAEFATMFYRFAGSPDAPETGKFTDLTEDWYKKAVNWAASCGVINGTSDTTFSPDNTVTREQLAAVFYRYAKAQGVDVTVAEARLLTNGAYADASQISDYALVPMSWCMTHYFFGTYSKLTPTGEIPLCAPRFNTFRRETTEAFFRFWNLLPKHSQAELA